MSFRDSMDHYFGHGSRLNATYLAAYDDPYYCLEADTVELDLTPAWDELEDWDIAPLRPVLRQHADDFDDDEIDLLLSAVRVATAEPELAPEPPTYSAYVGVTG